MRVALVVVEELRRRARASVPVATSEELAAESTPAREDETAAGRGVAVLGAALAVRFVLALEDVEGALERDELGAGDLGADCGFAGVELVGAGFERVEAVAFGLDTGFEVNAGCGGDFAVTTDQGRAPEREISRSVRQPPLRARRR